MVAAGTADAAGAAADAGGDLGLLHDAIRLVVS